MPVCVCAGANEKERGEREEREKEGERVKGLHEFYMMSINNIKLFNHSLVGLQRASEQSLPLC